MGYMRMCDVKLRLSARHDRQSPSALGKAQLAVLQEPPIKNQNNLMMIEGQMLAVRVDSSVRSK